MIHTQIVNSCSLVNNVNHSQLKFLCNAYVVLDMGPQKICGVTTMLQSFFRLNRIPWPIMF